MAYIVEARFPNGQQPVHGYVMQLPKAGEQFYVLDKIDGNDFTLVNPDNAHAIHFAAIVTPEG